MFEIIQGLCTFYNIIQFVHFVKNVFYLTLKEMEDRCVMCLKCVRVGLLKRFQLNGLVLQSQNYK